MRDKESKSGSVRVGACVCECVECILVTDRQPRDGEERWQGLNEKTNGLMRKIVASKSINGVFNETRLNIWCNSTFYKYPCSHWVVKEQWAQIVL